MYESSTTRLNDTLIIVPTKEGDATFWLSDLLDIRDTSESTRINLRPVSDEPRYILTTGSAQAIYNSLMGNEESDE